MASSSGQPSTQLKSPPAEKAPPSAATTITRTVSSAVNASTASRIMLAVSASIEFISLPRFSRSVATPSAMEVRTGWPMAHSHPEDAELGGADGLVHGGREAERKRHARVDRIEDAVVP